MWTWHIQEDTINGVFEYTEETENVPGSWRRGPASAPKRKVVTVTAGEYEDIGTLRGIVQFDDWEEKRSYEDALEQGWGVFDIEIRVIDNNLEKFQLDYDLLEDLAEYGFPLSPGEKVKFTIDETPSTGF